MSLQGLAATLCLLALGLAGCAGDSGGSAKVSFDGAGNGSHADEAKCDDEGTLIGSGDVDAGQVTVRVRDGDGRQVFSRTLDGGFNVESEKLTGASGDWEIAATRSSDSVLDEEFSGDYTFRLAC